MPNANCKLQNDHTRGGGSAAFTLVELLVTIMILAMVAAATIPMVLPALDGRRIRESARIVNTQFAAAQSQAVTTGQPVGVWLERLENSPTGVMDLFLCEVPPPYAGSTSQAVAKVERNGNVYSFKIYADPTSMNPETDEYGLSANLIRPGDSIRFNYRGPLVQIAATASGDPNLNIPNTRDGIDYIYKGNNTRGGNGIVLVTPATNANTLEALATSGVKVPFQIFRQPIKSSATPITLPVGTMIDLAWSGPGNELFNLDSYFKSTFPTNRHPILVIFGKSGELEAVSAMGNRIIKFKTPVHFLIGKTEKATTLSPPDNNLTDPENIWVSINPQLGLVSTAENIEGGDLAAAREIANSAQTMGGR